MKTYPTKFAPVVLSVAMLATSVVLEASTSEGASVFVDFGAVETTDTGYTEFSISSTGSVSSFEQSLSDLEDTEGTSTGFNFTLNVANGSRNVAGSNSGNDHDAVTGIATNATTDGIWFNNQNTGTAGGESFGFTLTFTNLDSNYAYDITVLMGDGTTTDFTWQIATGTGDSDAVTITSSTDISAAAEWTSVTPVDGTIAITGLADGPLAGSLQGRLNLVSLTAVAIPEVSSAIPFGVFALACSVARRKRLSRG